MPIHDIYGLRAALDNIKNDPDILKRHSKIGHATRIAVKEAGLTLHLESGYSNTVTVIDVPDHTSVKAILETMKERYSVMIAGSFDVLSGKVIRIGHMGENATIDHMAQTLEALDGTFQYLNIELNASLKEVFLRIIRENA